MDNMAAPLPPPPLSHLFTCFFCLCFYIHACVCAFLEAGEACIFLEEGRLCNKTRSIIKFFVWFFFVLWRVCVCILFASNSWQIHLLCHRREKATILMTDYFESKMASTTNFTGMTESMPNPGGCMLMMRCDQFSDHSMPANIHTTFQAKSRHK